MGLGLAVAASAPSSSSGAALAVVEKMMAMNAARAQALHAYTALQHYQVTYHGLMDATAEMQVRVSYQQPGPPQMTVVEEDGSELLRHHVLEPLLRVEAARPQDLVITPEGYSFELKAAPPESSDFILQVTPRKHEHSWFQGRMWIHPGDYAIERMQGQLTQSPSWWVTHTQLDYQTQQVGDFWLPASHHAVSRTRFWGHAELDIRSEDFQLTSTTPVLVATSGGGAKER